MVRAHIPFYERRNELPAIIQKWHRSKVLGRTTKDLLADIVTRGPWPNRSHSRILGIWTPGCATWRSERRMQAVVDGRR